MSMLSAIAPGYACKAKGARQGGCGGGGVIHPVQTRGELAAADHLEPGEAHSLCNNMKAVVEAMHSFH